MKRMKMKEHQRTAPGATLLDETGLDETGLDDTVVAEPVPHAEPLTDEQLNQQISETIPELLKRIHDVGQNIAIEFGLTGSDAMALLKLDAPMTMKELGQRMGCDPSFITTIADALEKHGLARREPSLRDRRSKNIVLTPQGATVRDRIYAELMARAPWCTGLDTGERRCLLGLMRKMLRSCGGR
jgi:MarR family transcriptional regulator, organic hydroperoxide resistance regulator